MGRPRAEEKIEKTEEATVVDTTLDSDAKFAGKPVVRYETKEEKERGDKLYTCRVTNNQLGRGEGNDSVSINGFTQIFPLGAQVKLRGFQIDVLRSCKYKAPVMKEVDGNLKMAGYAEHNVYAVDVEF